VSQATVLESKYVRTQQSYNKYEHATTTTNQTKMRTQLETSTAVNQSIPAHTQPFNGPFSGTIWVSQYQKGKTNLDFTEARDSEWQ